LSVAVEKTSVFLCGIVVFLGIRTVNNRTLGRFQLEGIPLASRGVPQIEVTFDIDANGIVHVSAKDRGTNKEQKIAITTGSTLTEDEINRMVKEAEEFKEQDDKMKAQVDAKNELESYTYQLKTAATDDKNALEEEDRNKLKEKLSFGYVKSLKNLF
jgi:molecular chaperone DnaK (HSP70)